jgi:hypothetical protein
MTSEPQISFPSPVSNCGFVVAMRAKLVGASLASLYEWMIVSRWGTDGEYLSIAWTSMPARPGPAPFNLTPRQTAYGVRRERPSAWVPPTFQLAAWLPGDLPMAGEFVPAEGFVRLYGAGNKLRIRSEGKCVKPNLRLPWNVDATRAAWIGEFVETKDVLGADLGSGLPARARPGLVSSGKPRR